LVNTQKGLRDQILYPLDPFKLVIYIPNTYKSTLELKHMSLATHFTQIITNFIYLI